MLLLYVEPFQERYWNAAVPYPMWPLLDVMDSACFARQGSWTGCSVGRLQVTRSSVIDAYWSEQAGVFFVNANSSSLVAVRADVRNGSMEVFPVALKMDRNVAAEIDVRGPVPSIDAEQESARRDTMTALRERILYRSLGVLRYDDLRVSSSGRDMAFLARRRHSIDIEAFFESDRLEGELLPQSMLTLGGMRDHLRPIGLYRGVDGSSWVVGGGDALRRPASRAVGARWGVAEQPSGFGSRAVVEVGSGKLIGLHTEVDVRWISPDSRLAKLTSAVRSQLGRAGVIHSLQISMAGGRAFALIQDLARGGVYSMFDWDAQTSDWRATTLVCRSDKAIPDLSAETLDIGEPGWRIPARWYRRPGSTRLLIYIHGGPESSLVRDHYESVVREFVPRGMDVVMFDYSGALGAGFDIANRASAGAGAWMRDAYLVAQYLNREVGQYERASLAASSFGALLAPTIIESLNDRLFSISLGVPFLRYRTPDESDDYEPRLVVWRLRDRQYLGLDEPGVRELKVVLAAQQSRLKPDKRYLVYFGSKDEKSRPEDFVNRGEAVVDIVNGGHDVWSSYMACWHDNLCQPPEGGPTRNIAPEVSRETQ